jgi:hypothetical protein
MKISDKTTRAGAASGSKLTGNAALDHFVAPPIARHDEGSEVTAAEAKRAERHHNDAEIKATFVASRCCTLTLLIAAIGYEVLPNLATVRVITTSLGDKRLPSTIPNPKVAPTHRRA